SSPDDRLHSPARVYPRRRHRAGLAGSRSAAIAPGPGAALSGTSSGAREWQSKPGGSLDGRLVSDGGEEDRRLRDRPFTLEGHLVLEGARSCYQRYATPAPNDADLLI